MGTAGQGESSVTAFRDGAVTIHTKKDEAGFDLHNVPLKLSTSYVVAVGIDVNPRSSVLIPRWRLVETV